MPMPDVVVSYERRDLFRVRIRDHRIWVDQPTGSGGDDAGPTPVELFVASLVSCVGFYAERFMRRHDIGADGLRVECDFEMSEIRPARVSAIDVRVILPAAFPEARREALLRVIDHCTVHNSLRETPAVRTSLSAGERMSAIS
jgi:putative redox protein